MRHLVQRLARFVVVTIALEVFRRFLLPLIWQKAPSVAKFVDPTASSAATTSPPIDTTAR